MGEGEGREGVPGGANDGSVGAAPLFLVVHSSLLHPKLLSNRGAEGAMELERASLGAGSRVVCVEEGGSGVVLEERLQEHANCAKDTDEDKDPKEQAVNHHGNILPVLTHLERGRVGDSGINHIIQEGPGSGISNFHHTSLDPRATVPKFGSSLACLKDSSDPTAFSSHPNSQVNQEHP